VKKIKKTHITAYCPTDVGAKAAENKAVVLDVKKTMAMFVMDMGMVMFVMDDSVVEFVVDIAAEMPSIKSSPDIFRLKSF
jgi:hypothetical protein